MRQKFKLILLLGSDLIAFFLALVIALLFYTKGSISVSVFERHLQVFSFVFPAWIIIFYIEGLYSLKSFRLESLTAGILRAHAISLLLSFALFYFFPMQGLTPKTNLIIIVLSSIILTFLSRKLFFSFFTQRRLQENLIVLSKEELSSELKDHLGNHSHLGIHFSEAFSTEDSFLNSKDTDQVDIIAIEENFLSNPEITSKLISLVKNGVVIIDITDFFELTTGKIPLKALNTSWFIKNSFSIMHSNNPLVKGLFDKVIAVIIAILVLPLLLMIAPVLIIFSGFPLLYSQKRVGLKGKDFTIYKLRTMSNNAEKSGAQWSRPGDSRVTRIGKFLRATRIDELPQLYNIIKGDMSLVGPRPERPEIIQDKLGDIPFYEYRHLVKPGVTGWAQVNYRYGFSEEDTVKKLQYDLYYVKNQSIWLDIRVILRTIKTVLTGAGL